MIIAGLLATGLSTSEAFYWNAIISAPISGIFYSFYFSPKFYPEAEKILKNKK